MSEIIFLVGPSGSGKSTWANKRKKEYIIINRDSIRQELTNTKARLLDNTKEMVVTSKQTIAIQNAVKNNEKIIIDNTNLKVEYINSILKIIDEYKNTTYNCKLKLFNTPLWLCKLRVFFRNYNYSLSYIDKQHKQFKKLKKLIIQTKDLNEYVS
jgi:predicted kinase